jgi:hypothetical protein
LVGGSLDGQHVVEIVASLLMPITLAAAKGTGTALTVHVLNIEAFPESF